MGLCLMDDLNIVVPLLSRFQCRINGELVTLGKHPILDLEPMTFGDVVPIESHLKPMVKFVVLTISDLRFEISSSSIRLPKNTAYWTTRSTSACHHTTCADVCRCRPVVSMFAEALLIRFLYHKFVTFIYKFY